MASSARMIMCNSFTSLANSTRMDANLRGATGHDAIIDGKDGKTIHRKRHYNTLVVVGQHGCALVCQAIAGRKNMIPFKLYDSWIMKGFPFGQLISFIYLALISVKPTSTSRIASLIDSKSLTASCTNVAV